MNTIYRILYLILALLGASTAMRAQEIPDTLLNVAGNSKVIITESASGTTVMVKGVDEENPFEATVVTEYGPESSVSVKQETRSALLEWINDRNITMSASHWNLSIDGICLGLTSAMGGRSGDMQWSKSFEISWLNCIKVMYSFSRSDISLGLGFDWRNYKCTMSERRLVVNDGNYPEWAPYPEGSRPKNSRLKVFSLQFPFLYTWDIPKSELKLKLGPILNCNTYASVKSVYDDASGNRCEEFNKKIGINKTTVDFFGSLSYSGTIGIYVRYSPCKVLKDPSPINFNPLTVGFTLFI